MPTGAHAIVDSLFQRFSKTIRSMLGILRHLAACQCDLPLSNTSLNDVIVLHDILWRSWLTLSPAQSQIDTLNYAALLQSSPLKGLADLTVYGIAPLGTLTAELDQGALRIESLRSFWAAIPVDSRVTDLLSTIGEQYVSPSTSLLRISDSVGLCPRHINRLIRRCTGESYMACVRHLRLRDAKALLAVSAWSVAAIAAHIGYSKASWFSRVFHAESGLSPIESVSVPDDRWAPVRASTDVRFGA